MKPRTKLQRTIAEASRKLPPLTPAQIQWGYKHCIEHIGRRTSKGLITCTECGHTWRNRSSELTDTGCECPACHTRLRVETTSRRTFYDYEYLCIVTRCAGFQVLRYVYIECRASTQRPPVYTHVEAIQQWIAPDGRYVTFARLRPMGYFTHGWCYSTPLEIRTNNSYKYDVVPTGVYPHRCFIPEVRMRGYKTIAGINSREMICRLLTENQFETLCKTGQLGLLKLFLQSNRELSDYWPSIRIAIRNGYRIDRPTEWCDYIDSLRFFGKDLRNAHFVCPSDLMAAHDHYMAKKRKEIERQFQAEARQRALQNEAAFFQAKGCFFGVEFSDGQIQVKVLDSIEAIRQEGEAMHHCVFANKYYLKPDSLILSATIDGRRIETVEVSLKRLQVVQSRGVCNQNTAYHDRIIQLVNRNIHLIRERITA